MAVGEPRTSVADSPGADVAWHDPPSWLPATFHSLAYRDYRYLWLGQISNSLSLWMDMIARPVLVVAITGSAVHLGLVTLVRGAPMMLLSPLAGVLADRMDRRVIMLIAKLLTLAMNVVFALVIITGQLELWHVYVTALIKAMLMSLDQPARQALLPALVPPRLLTNAVALNFGTMQLTRILSASVAGFLIALWAVAFGFGRDEAEAFGGVYLAVVATYILSVVATYLLRVPEGGRVVQTEDTWFTSMITGFRYALKHPVILGILILFAVQSAFGMPYLMVFVPWLAIQVMGLGPEGAGLLVAISGVGSLVGAVAVASAGPRLRRRGSVIIAGLVAYGVALAALGVGSLLPVTVIYGLLVPVVPVVMLLLVGVGQTVLMTLKNTLLLEATPNELRGRVMSLQHMDRGFSTLGGAAAGLTIAAIGGPWALALFGALCAAGSVIVAAFSPALRRAD